MILRLSGHFLRLLLDYGTAGCEPLDGETKDTGRFARWFELKLISAAVEVGTSNTMRACSHPVTGCRGCVGALACSPFTGGRQGSLVPHNALEDPVDPHAVLISRVTI